MASLRRLARAGERAQRLERVVRHQSAPDEIPERVEAVARVARANGVVKRPKERRTSRRERGEDGGRSVRHLHFAHAGSETFRCPQPSQVIGKEERDASVAVAERLETSPDGTTLRWPAFAAVAASAGQAHSAAGTGRGPTRTVGATVLLVDGALAGYLARGERQLITWLPDNEPQRSRTARALAQLLADRSQRGGDAPRGLLLEEIDGLPARLHPLVASLAEAGFSIGALGLQRSARRE